MSTQTITPTSSAQFAQDYRTKLLDVIGGVDLNVVGRVIDLLKEARDKKRHVFTCGNGGSASTASRCVTDMVKGASYNRDARFRIMALTDSLPTITAYANDVSYDCIFTEQLKNFAERDDILIAISGSGNSPNVVKAVEYANSIGCKTIALTGRDGGKLGPLAHIKVRGKAAHKGPIEDGPLFVCPLKCLYFMEN